MQEDQIHSIEEAAKIFQFFSTEEIKIALGLNDQKRDKNKYRNTLLEKEKVKDIHGLLYKLTNSLEKEDHREKILSSFQFSQEEKNIEGVNISLNEMGIKEIFSTELKPENFNYWKVENALKEVVGDWLWLRVHSKHRSLSERFKEKFPKPEDLYHASVDQLQKIKDIGPVKAQEIYSALQKMKVDPSYFRRKTIQPFKKKEEESSSINGTSFDQQVYSVSVQSDLIQKAYNLIDIRNKQTILTQEEIDNVFPYGSFRSLEKRKIFIDPFIRIFDEKLRNQAEYYEQEGVMFESLESGLLNGAVRFFRSTLIGFMPTSL